MATEIRVPTLGESVTEATVGQWLKKVGDVVKADEPLVELETDKVTLEVPAPSAGVIASIEAKDGSTVGIGALLGSINADASAVAKAASAAKAAPAKSEAPAATKPAPAPAPQPAAPQSAGSNGASPAAKKILTEKNVAPAALSGTGKDGRVTKADAVAAVIAPTPAGSVAVRAPSLPDDAAREERVRMSRLRQTIARRLKDAQNTAAMLTTFNEVDMGNVIALRTEYRDLFEKKHGVKLGFMGFFVKACIQALKEIPAVNAEIDGQDIVYKNYYHVGIAVGTDKGLVVPVVRDADHLSLAEIEKSIASLGKRARDGELKIEEMQGGTFTITNGGIYGSLMSTPILNAPQSGILGMHKIQERPMVVAGKIEVRPMMYLALSYDHRIVDGREAVTFLVRVKEGLEDPQRLVLDLSTGRTAMDRFRVASLAALGLGLIGFGALADPINPQSLVPALGVYVDAMTADHAAALACARPELQARDEGDWGAAKAIFLATLWANDFPQGFVREAAARFEAEPSFKPDCSDKDTLERIRDPDHEGWPAYLAHGLSGMDLKPVFPVTGERWQAIKDTIARELPAQKRSLNCIAVMSPEFLPVAVHDWDQMLTGVGSKLAAAGLPRDEVAATIAAAEANTLWKRAAGGDIAAIRTDCAKDNDWSDRFFGLKFLALAGAVDQLLPPSQSSQ